MFDHDTSAEEASIRSAASRSPETVPLSLLSLRIDGVPVELRSGSTVAAAMVIAGVDFARRSVSGEPRAPLCGMGVCFECRVSIDGVAHRRACQVICRSGMEVSTDD